MIRRLSPELTRRIAAGEVITRPLDAVRELIENALDATATRIEIELGGGGLDFLEVRDNGVGIPEAEVALAPLRHTTSKLAGESLADIATLGFRGEALWSIAWAGELSLLTRPPGQLGATLLRARGDRITTERARGPQGTRARVTGLFAELPARLRTQASPAAEYREVLALVGRYVLHRPELHWRVVLDGETRLSHAPGDVRAAVASVYGALPANRLLTVDAAGVHGAVSRPELTRPRRDRMHLAVNGRPVEFPAELERAVLRAYGELLPQGQAPLAVLSLEVPPAWIDPNVHPHKARVALARLDELAARLEAAVRAALAAHPLAGALPALRAAQTPSTPASGFPELRPIGVYRDLYLLAEGEGDLWLIDAHAAHERVLFERFDAAFARAESVELALPEMLQLTPEQQARLHERAPELAAWGLLLEDFGAGLARVRAVPAVLAGLPLPRLAESLLEAALADTPDPRRAVLARMACAPALKAGAVRLEGAAELLGDLAVCAQPWACPHGRPTVLRLSERDLAHAFGRRGVRDLPSGRDRVPELPQNPERSP
ncbi:DNA mismatch repair protein MutL [Deinobacterium chartae]|uniref:DNA mismatch repair protein MutL n=1 Tax=Deinobacterium chartae TaxID=521158 RepID=A0A841HY93_9DEIO|nr:DNA mismatch repair protein MutL [Deinobacterium chartae]